MNDSRPLFAVHKHRGTDLRRNSSVVAAWVVQRGAAHHSVPMARRPLGKTTFRRSPKCIGYDAAGSVALDPAPARHAVLDGQHQGVAQVQRARHVWRRDGDDELFPLAHIAALACVRPTRSASDGDCMSAVPLRSRRVADRHHGHLRIPA